MALELKAAPEGLMSDAELAAWHDIPPAVISDELNRTGAMAAAIKPLAPGMRVVGQALTVQTMVGDNAALHYCLTVAWPGAVIVVDARGHPDTAVWGGILTYAAKHVGVAGVVVDGSVRDVAELRESGIAVYARGAIPSGPHKGWGGSVNVPIQCGGVAVDPGDLIVADDDGVVAVGRRHMAGLLERCQARIAKEKTILERIDAGVTTVELQGLPPANDFGG